MEFKQKLETALNRPVTDNFLRSLEKYIHLGVDLDKFISYGEVLGINGELCRDIYTNTTGAVEKKNKRLINYEEETEVKEKPNFKKSIKFKRIRKEKALNFKQAESERESEPKPESKPEPEPEPEPGPELLESDNSTSLLHHVNSVNDANETEDYVDDSEGRLKSIIPPVFKQKSLKENGGLFHNGEYIDFDHSQTKNKVITITSHFFIPPFLEKDKQFLTIQITEKSGFLRINNFDPIKDHNTHLAIISKQGSALLNETRSKKEKAKQAKEHSQITGTKLGNVIGINPDSRSTSAETPVNITKSDQLTLLNQRRALPAYAVKQDLLKVIQENQVIIVIGETGSGKTTQLTQYLYESNYGSNMVQNGTRKMIGCTQPRRVAAMSVAKRVSEEMNVQLGHEVGYTIRFEDKTTPEKTIIKYMTDGILLREILLDANLDNYSCIIMDEAHERSLNTDILLGLLRLLIMKRKDLKLIITSATINADYFSVFFGHAPQFTIPGRTYPVEVSYVGNSQDYVESTVRQVITVHLDTLNPQGESDGDILVFMTGQEDIETTCELIQQRLDDLNIQNMPPLEILPIYSTLPPEVQLRIFSKLDKHKRKCVVATNIAETSLTIDGVKYVIDCGLIKLKVYNPKLGMDMLTTIPISIANGNQRSGRAGRTGPGKCFRLYPETEFTSERLNVMPIPEIKRANLSNVMLLLKSLNVVDLKAFPFIDSPPNELLSCSLYDLWCLGALDNLGRLSDLGRKMVDFPMEPALSKLIILSTRDEFKCSFEILTIVAMLSVPSVFHRSKERQDEADMAREKFAIRNLDHLTLLNIYNQWENQLKSTKSTAKVSFWCTKNFLNAKALIRAKDIRNQLVLIMKNKKLPVVSNKDDEIIKKCICATFFQQLARLLKINLLNSNQIEYINLRHHFMKLYLHPTSVLNNSRDLAPEYVVYHELILTKKEYMSCITEVDPWWLYEYGYLFYDISSDDRTKFHLPDLKQQFEKALQASKSTYNKPGDVKNHPKPKKPFRPRGI